MIIVIIGVNRAEYCVLSKRQLGLHFFKTRNQLYKVFPDGAKRIRIFDYGKEITSERGIIFAENDTHPYDECEIDYSMDRLLGDVDRHKMMRNTGWAKPKIWFSNAATSLIKKIGLPTLIVGGIIIYAFITQYIQG